MADQKDSSTLVLYVIAALLLVVGVAWVFLSLREPAPSVVSEPITPLPAPLEVPDQIDPRFDLEENIDMGEMALSAGQLVEPADGSALYFFLSALEQDPDNRAARDGLRAISSTIAARAAEQLAGEDYLALDGSLRVLRRIDAADATLLALNEQLAAVVEEKLAAVDGATRRSQWLPAQALIDQLATIPSIDPDALELRRAELIAAQERAEALAQTVAEEAAAAAAAAQTAADAADTADEDAEEPDNAGAEPEDATGGDYVAGLVDSVRESLADGRLVEPSDNSAAYFLDELRAVAPDSAELSQGYSNLIGALTGRASTNARDGEFAAADALLAAATDLGVQDERIVAARTTVRNARIEAESQRIIPVGQMVNTKVVRPRYPSRALRNDTEGFVRLNFTVLSDGTTADIVVVESSERYSSQFARAAQVAVGQWEFVPREFEGQVIDQRVEARVAFEIDQ